MFAIYTPATITNAPSICHIVKLSFKIATAHTMATTVATPMNEATRLTPIFAIATFDIMNPAIEHPIA